LKDSFLASAAAAAFCTLKGEDGINKDSGVANAVVKTILNNHTVSNPTAT